MLSRKRAFLVGLFCLAFCTLPVAQRVLTRDPATLDHKSKYLKAHLGTGELYLLSDWSVDDAQKIVSGTGDRLDANRQVIEHGKLSLAIDSVALFETNVISKSPRMRALSVMTGVTAAVTALCLASPKACFGSCPTFYASDGEKPSLQAEGFSASVLPSLEETDLDALYRARPAAREFVLRMTNEAQETHVVRSVRLICAPRPEGTRVFATANREFWQSSLLVAPSECHAPEGDCRRALRAFDGVERFSVANRDDLSRHETIDLEFDAPSDGASLGIVLAARQTLLSTFLLYQTYAYLGTRATESLAALERKPRPADSAGGIARLLGGIDVLTDTEAGWRLAGSFHETGPLATDTQLIPIQRARGSKQRVRLHLAEGLWRVDYVALARLDRRVEGRTLQPTEVHAADRAADLPSFSSPLVTLPGDSYTFLFSLPADFANQELFLESRGYYLEWMREEWMHEESRVRAAMMFLTPHLALRVLAPEFKKIEPQMESRFWNSRYALR